MDANSFLLACCIVLAAAVTVLSILLVRFRSFPRIWGPDGRSEAPLTCGYDRNSDKNGQAGKFFRDVAAGDEYQSLKEQLDILMEEKKLFLEPGLKIVDVAQMLRVSETHLSKVIKLKTGNNFRHLIHSFRVKEAMRLFALNPDLTIVDLMHMVGFNSQTTFNSAFSRCTGYTPAEWCREYLRNRGNDARANQR